MRIISILFFAITISNIAHAQDQEFTIKGQLTDAKESKVFLYFFDKTSKVDSVVSKDGSFVFKGKANLPVLATLDVDPVSPKNVSARQRMRSVFGEDRLDFYIDTQVLLIRGKNAETATVAGGFTAAEFAKLHQQMKHYKDSSYAIIEKRIYLLKEKKDTAAADALIPDINAFAPKIENLRQAFVARHPDSYVSFDIIKEKSNDFVDMHKLEAWYNGLNHKIRSSKQGKEVAERIALAKKTAVGRPAIDFTQNDTEEKTVSLSSFKGKYVFLKFWASWCAPCRKENANLVKVYNEFQDANFQIIAVSLDTDKNAWFKAIKDDGLTFLNVSDLKGQQNAVVQEYGIYSLSENLLIDPQGIIVGKNLHGEELAKKLGEVMGQKGFEVSVDLQNVSKRKVVMAYMKGESLFIDTNAIFEKGRYIFKGSVKEPTPATILLGKERPELGTDSTPFTSPWLRIILSNEKILLTGDMKKLHLIEVKGGKQNDEWNRIRKQEALLVDKQWNTEMRVYKQFNETKDSSLWKQLEIVCQEVEKEDDQLKVNFIKENPASFVSIYFLSELLDTKAVNELDNLYKGLAEEYKATDIGKNTFNLINGMKAAVVGKRAIELNKKDLNGNIVNLASLKGKYVLLDFWGTWCGPCRASHPHLKELYSMYKDKGFEIVGIASEGGTVIEARPRWIDAIKEDDIGWVNILNNEGIKEFDAVESYGVTAFPTKFILDKEGRILAKFVGDEHEELDQLLESLFKK